MHPKNNFHGAIQRALSTSLIPAVTDLCGPKFCATKPGVCLPYKQNFYNYNLVQPGRGSVGILQAICGNHCIVGMEPVLFSGSRKLNGSGNQPPNHCLCEQRERLEDSAWVTCLKMKQSWALFHPHFTCSRQKRGRCGQPVWLLDLLPLAIRNPAQAAWAFRYITLIWWTMHRVKYCDCSIVVLIHFLLFHYLCINFCEALFFVLKWNILCALQSNRLTLKYCTDISHLEQTPQWDKPFFLLVDQTKESKPRTWSKTKLL